MEYCSPVFAKVASHARPRGDTPRPVSMPAEPHLHSMFVAMMDAKFAGLETSACHTVYLGRPRLRRIPSSHISLHLQSSSKGVDVLTPVLHISRTPRYGQQCHSCEDIPYDCRRREAVQVPEPNHIHARSDVRSASRSASRTSSPGPAPSR
ncbi:hypothetical protein PYCCODRAFT_377647 [Trametes coccinea BRFM310]|uniref:Uncharacterized protein n=1 Tax=Trametes coccinea (strain BRFM310) TaxID=1353009 RepID=A0A1Y2J3M3_TRAC3|nr:hypothetical protein PYCCODRAFT_377647 [Trametes coccinea BRFM310]